MLRDSFLLFTEQIELLEQLTDEQAGKLIKSIYHYAQTGEEENLDPMSRLVFTSMRQDLDRNAQKYEEKRQKMSENGRKGGATHVTLGHATSVDYKPNAFTSATHVTSGHATSVDYKPNVFTPATHVTSGHAASVDDKPDAFTPEAVGQALPDNSSDLTNNLYGNKLPTSCILSSEGEENRDETQQNSSDEMTNEEKLIDNEDKCFGIPLNKAHTKVTSLYFRRKMREEREIFKNDLFEKKLALNTS